MSCVIIAKPGKPAEEIPLRKETQKEIEDTVAKYCGREWQVQRVTTEQNGDRLCIAFPAHQDAKGLQRNRMGLKGCICCYWERGGQKAGITEEDLEAVNTLITLRSDVPMKM